MKNVLVTGGTGSVGSSVVERLLTTHAEVEQVVIYSRDEHKQGEMARDLSAHARKLDFILGDIRDCEHLQMALQGIDTVIHTAAMRLVPHAEANPAECIRINADGAMSLVAAVRNSDVKRVVAISSDKAVEPTTIYGASKFAMERILISADKRGKTRYTVVRYANILNSRSSVAPLFIKQRETGMLTLTNPEMTRFSIVMREGVDLILFGLINGWGGEIICPISPSYKVKDMALAIAPDADHKIIGARPGEKKHETMYAVLEAPYVVKRGKYLVITPQAGRWTKDEYCRSNLDAEPVDVHSDYCSGTNSHWLGVKDLQQIICREVETAEMLR